MTNIVVLNVSQTQAPTPATLQQSGAFVSQGATTLAAGTFQFLPAVGSLTSILSGAIAISAATNSAGLNTYTTATPHGYTVGDSLLLTVTGMTPNAYNNTTRMATITSTTQFTIGIGSAVGAATVFGVVTVEDVAELVAMNSTFFGMGNAVGVYVLELGPGNPNDGITALTAFFAGNVPQMFYSFLMPRAWGSATYAAAVQTFVAAYQSLTAKRYFHITALLATYASFTALDKCVILTVEAPAVAAAWLAAAATEFSAAAGFYEALNNNPSTASMVAPSAFSYLYGVTPYPTQGNATTLAELQTAAVNVVGTGAEGGIATAIWLYGTTLDGNDFSYWFAVDWVQINSDIGLANAVINGSNNPLAPLYYSQPGIDTLQAREASIMKQAIGYGLALGQLVTTQLSAPAFAAAVAAGTYSGQVVVNAIPFSTYVAANPSDYPAGIYRGLQVAFTPNRGFKQIIVNLNVANFVTV